MLVAFLVLFGGCSAAPNPELDLLRAMPEGTLAPDGVEQLADGGREADQSIAARVPASTWRIYGTDASAADVIAFYASELADRGWSEGGGVSGIRGTHELDVAAWHKEGVIFRLGFWKLDEWRLSQNEGLEYDTIFEGSLIQDPADEES